MNKMKRTAVLALVLALLTAVLCSCGQGEKVLTSSDGKYQMTVPGIWTDKLENAGDSAILSAGNASGSQYIMVSELDAASIGELSLEEYSETFSTYFAAQMTDPTVEKPAAVTVNGYSGYTTQVSGVSQEVGLTYWITMLDYDEAVPCLIAWTSTDRAESGKAELDQVIQSFGPAV